MPWNSSPLTLKARGHFSAIPKRSHELLQKITGEDLNNGGFRYSQLNARTARFLISSRGRVEREEMLDYLKGKIRRPEDEAALEEIFSIYARNVDIGGGKLVDEAVDAAATFLHMREWSEVVLPRVSQTLEAAKTAFMLILLAHGSEESRASDRRRLQEWGEKCGGGLSLDEALVELSYLHLFACHYAIVMGQPQTDFRESVGHAYLANLLYLAEFTFDPDQAVGEQDRRFRLYGSAADVDFSGRSTYMHVGQVFGRLCGVEDIRLTLPVQIIFSALAQDAAKFLSEFLASAPSG